MAETTPDVVSRAARIRLLLMDVDGVLTDGRLFPAPGAGGGMVETKGFDSQDGISLQWAQGLGIETGVISGRDSPAVASRASQCRIKYIFQGHIEKIPVYEKILNEAGASDEQVGYIGDDLTDAPIMQRVGLAAAPSNARPEIKRIAHLVTRASGGRGAVREVIEVVLRAQGKWEQVLRKYGIAGPSG